MQITLCARSKILQLSHDGNPFRIRIHGDMIAGSHVDLEPNAKQTVNDVTICDMPLIIADIASVNFLGNKKVDFDYDHEEFIISNRGNEH